METWFAEAQALPAVEAEICFSIQESLDCGAKYGAR